VVRFTIPDTSWIRGQFRGEVYRDADALILEYQEYRWPRRSELKELRIPFAEITSISCQVESWSNLPKEKMPKWMRKWGNMELIPKVARREVLAGLPVGKHGRGRFRVHWADRAAAQQLVDSIVRPVPPQSDIEPFLMEPGGQRPLLDLEKAHMEVAAPAVGLILTGLVAILSGIVFGGFLPFVHFDGDGTYQYWLAPAMGLVMTVGGWFVLVGGIRMLRLRSYSSAVAAAILALIPWSPGWLLGLPFGIVGLVVLRKRGVMAAFLNRQRAADLDLRASAQQGGRLGGKMVSLFRSMGRYFIHTSAGSNKAADTISRPGKEVP